MSFIRYDLLEGMDSISDNFVNEASTDIKSAQNIVVISSV